MPGVSLTLDSDLMRQSLDSLAVQGLSVGPLGFIGITLMSGLFAAVTINAAFAFGYPLRDGRDVQLYHNTDYKAAIDVKVEYVVVPERPGNKVIAIWFDG